jgi:hypothetical protein
MNFPAILLVIVSFAPQLFAAGWSATGLSECDALFQRTNGWIGADGDFTVRLTNGLTLWLFSDTFVGDVRSGHRINARMINNSAAWQQGDDAASARVTFFHGGVADKPAALIVPADGRGWFWPFDGAMVDGKLFLFLVQLEHTGEQSVFGFRQTGNWLGEVSNPLAPPTEWRLTQKKIPFAQFAGAEKISFGSATLLTNGLAYIFGTRERDGVKLMILARAPAAELADFSSWRFRASSGWTTNVAEAAGLCRNLASEYSVSWLPAARRFVLIQTENGLSEKILARTAPEPWGPWSTPTVVFRCPEAAWNKKILCYAAKAHPMLAGAPDELIVTYAANAWDSGQLFSDARLYWPRFVRVKWSKTSSATR